VKRTLAASSRQLGAFALFRDDVAPRIARSEAARESGAEPYSRWALEAVVEEEGSGVDARASWFEVDGRRVATEWDPEAGRLRWRPAQRPSAAPRQVLVVAADRAGNVTRIDLPLPADR
jgi:hypothetical protein